MIAPCVALDEHTEADISHAPTCDAPLICADATDCPAPATWIGRISTHPWISDDTRAVLLCDQHADALREHFAHCQTCTLMLRLHLEPIGRRPT